MCKNCDNCYWKDFNNMWCVFNKEKPIENICNKFDFTCCECEQKSEYKYRGKHYCKDCLIENFKIETYEVTHYISDGGEELGTDEDLDEVIRKLSDEIESEEE